MKKSWHFFLVLCFISVSAEPICAQSNQISVVLSSRNLFAFNKLTGNKKQRDSLITAVENMWIEARQLIEKDNYAGAAQYLEKIGAQIDTYRSYCRKNRKTELVFTDTVKQLHYNCMFLDSMLPQIRLVTIWSDSIPENSDDLLLLNRHQLLSIKNRCKEVINDQIRRNPGRKGAIRFGFRKSIIKLNLLDSLTKAAYDQERSEFSLKNKFFYNRAIESNDTLQIRRFADDCDYYQVDKEWCTRARMILAGMDTQTVKADENTAEKKLSEPDLMKVRYQQAMLSRRTDLLEDYINRYSRKKIRKSESKIDSVRIMLEKVKKELAAEAAYNKAHPLFANSDPEKLDISIKGLSQTVQDIFRDVIAKNRNRLKSIPGVRFPASLLLDYSGSHPTLYMNTFINCKKDVQSTITDSATLYSIIAIPHLMLFLDQIKKAAAESVQEKATSEKITLAAYVVRLRKSSNEYITFYGKESLQSDDSGQDFSYYDFFDISVNDKKDIRFPNEPSNSVLLLKAENETEKNLLGNLFFEK